MKDEELEVNEEKIHETDDELPRGSLLCCRSRTLGLRRSPKRWPKPTVPSVWQSKAASSSEEQESVPLATSLPLLL